MTTQLEGLRVAILATDGFEQVELTEPRKALDEAGATTHVIAPKSGSIKAWDETDWGTTVDVDATLDEATPQDYDALLLPGGVLNPDHLRVNKKAVSFAHTFFDEGKPVAAICHGPQTLIEADVLRGRRMTSYASVQTDLKNAGANWVDEEVVVDGNLITSRKPDDIPAFNQAIIREFAKAYREATTA